MFIDVCRVWGVVGLYSSTVNLLSNYNVVLVFGLCFCLTSVVYLKSLLLLSIVHVLCLVSYEIIFEFIRVIEDDFIDA